jgi:WD40 repeat protein
LAPEKQAILLKDPGYSEFDADVRGIGEILAKAHGVAFSPDGRHVMIACLLGRKRFPSGGWGGSDGTLELWDVAAQRRLSIWNRQDLDILDSVRFSPDGKRVATTDGSLSVTIWDAATGKQLHQLRHKECSSVVSFSPDSRLVYSGGGGVSWMHQGFITINDVESGHELRVWQAHPGGVLGLAVSDNGRILASGGEDRAIRLWEVPSGRQLAQWDAHPASVTALAFKPGGMVLLSGAADGSLKLWDLPLIHRELLALGLDW